MNTIPRLSIKPGLIGSMIILGIMIAVTVGAWNKFPSNQLVPVHWGASGQPDSFEPAHTALIIMPIAVAILTGIFLLTGILIGKSRNDESATPIYTLIWMFLLVFLCVVHIAVVTAAIEYVHSSPG